MITGASGNLGRAVATAFIAQGANVGLIDRKREKLERTFGAEDAQTFFVIADLLDQRQVTAAAASIRERYGRIDVLCNIAGGFRMGEPVHGTSDDNWQFLFDVNARTFLNAVRAVVPQMIEAGGGKVVSVAAYGALKGGATMGPYAASKDVVVRLTESMAAELRTKNINVNCVLPTIIDTPDNRTAMPDADPSRWVAPEDLAKVIAFLASDDARAIHGASIPVTGLS